MAYANVPDAIGVLGVGALSSAMVQALHGAWGRMRFHLSPRNALAAEALQSGLPSRDQAVIHKSNQAVVDSCRVLIIGVRPAQLATLAEEIELDLRHHVLVLSAGTPLAELQALFAPARVSRLMTGLAVAGGQSAISCFPPSKEMQVLWQTASSNVVHFEVEAQFEASVLAVCANAWWLDQLQAMATWMAGTGMQEKQALDLLTANMADVAHMRTLNPDQSPVELARFIASPGTYTGQGLDHLQAVRAHQPWLDALELAYTRMRKG